MERSKQFCQQVKGKHVSARDMTECETEYEKNTEVCGLGHSGRGCVSNHLCDAGISETNIKSKETNKFPMVSIQPSLQTARSRASTQSNTTSVAPELSKTDLSDDGTSPATDTEVTTLMIYYIPLCMKREELIGVIHSLGFANTYDLLYIPTCKVPQNADHVGRTLGYAFVNFRKPEVAEAFAQEIEGFRFPRCASKKCKARGARIQGFEKNLEMHMTGASQGWLGTASDEGLMTWVACDPSSEGIHV